MVEIKPKPPEILEAQVATYAAEVVARQNSDQAMKLFEGLGDLGSDHSCVDSSFYPYYLGFLRTVVGSRYEAIEGRAKILSAYKRFQSHVDRLKNELTKLSSIRDHPAFLGNGSSSNVFSIDIEGQLYAIRIPNENRVLPPSIVDGHIASAILGEGVPHLEQIVAASYKDGVTVAKIMAGKEMGKLEINELKQVTDLQLDELIDTVIVANNRGINIDPKTSNIFYDSVHGFGIIDYHNSKISYNAGVQRIGDVVGWLSGPFLSAGFNNENQLERTVDDYMLLQEYYRIHYVLLIRYRERVTVKLGNHPDDLKIALKIIDEKIESLRSFLNDISNDLDWANAQLRNDQRVLEARATLDESGGWDSI
jgi:hypothetical protein